MTIITNVHRLNQYFEEGRINKKLFCYNFIVAFYFVRYPTHQRLQATDFNFGVYKSNKSQGIIFYESDSNNITTVKIGF